MHRILIAVLATVVATSNARASEADARAASEELIARGVDARLHEKHEEALELFRKAHVIFPSARTFAQMGLAELSLRKWREAEDHLQTALGRHDVPWVEDLRVRGVLEKSLEKARSHIGTLVVIGDEGAEVMIDGRSVGRLPLALPLRLAEGKVRVAGSAAGRRAAEVEVEVVGEHETTTRIELTRLELPAALRPAPVAPPVTAAAPPPAPTPPPAPVGVRWQTWTGVGLLVLSAGAAVTGAILLKIDGKGTCDGPPGDQCPQLWNTKALGIVSLVGAAVGAAGGITLLAWRPDDAPAHAAASMGLGVGWRF
jgi:hypothetical protein